MSVFQACHGAFERSKILILGQFLSFLIAGTGIFTQDLSQNHNFNFAAAQNIFNYLLLIGHLVWIIFPKNGTSSLQVPWWKYALIAFADVQGNYLVVSAYQYTSITSAMLLDCFTIPCCMILSKCFLHAKYESKHVMGVTACLFGIGVLVASDATKDLSSEDLEENSYMLANSTTLTSTTTTQVLYGDFLCLVGSSIYACSNVAQETKWGVASQHEFLGMLGLFGSIFCAVQVYLFEWSSFLHVEWTSGVVSNLFGYTAALFAMYNLTAIFLAEGDAAMFNLSLLTSDFYALIAGIYLFHEQLNMLYGIGFVLIIAGLVIYSRSDPPTSAFSKSTDGDERQRLLPSEEL